MFRVSGMDIAVIYLKNDIRFYENLLGSVLKFSYLFHGFRT